MGIEKPSVPSMPDEKMQNLELLLKEKQGFYTVEKINSRFVVKVGGSEFPAVFVTQDACMNAIRLIDRVLKLYREGGHSQPLYVDESISTKGDSDRVPEPKYLNIYVKNRLGIYDTEFISAEKISSGFGVSTARNNKDQIHKIAIFLNMSLSKMLLNPPN